MKLKDWLHKNGVAQAALAAHIGVTQAAVSMWVNGVMVPEPATMRKIHRVTGGKVTPNDFVLGKV